MRSEVFSSNKKCDADIISTIIIMLGPQRLDKKYSFKYSLLISIIIVCTFNINMQSSEY